MDIILPIALQYLNIPYIWGGKNPLVGLDCSGLSSVIVKAGGAYIPPDIESSQQQYDYFSELTNHINQKIECGTLIFYGTPGKIHHVAVAIDPHRHIEAGHGDQTVKSVQDAVNKGAHSRISAIRFNADFFGAFTPEYPGYPYP